VAPLLSSGAATRRSECDGGMLEWRTGRKICDGTQ
jgi:hypothetical protein